MAKICQLHADLHYFLCMEPVDMRKQFRGLQGIISEKYNRYLTQDEAFIFIGKTRTTGLTLYVRKLSEGRFQIPKLNEDKRTCNLDYKNFICLILGEKCVGE